MELKQVNKYGKAKCACCGYFTISEIAESCPVCDWEENIYQEEHTDDDDAPNYISLNKAKANFLKYAVKDQNLKEHVRPPKQEELDSSTT
jgi:hypothetical protein